MVLPAGYTVIQFQKIKLSWQYHTAVVFLWVLQWHFLHSCTEQINWWWKIATLEGSSSTKTPVLIMEQGTGQIWKLNYMKNASFSILSNRYFVFRQAIQIMNPAEINTQTSKAKFLNEVTASSCNWLKSFEGMFFFSLFLSIYFYCHHQYCKVLSCFGCCYDF